jgi:microsomal dipeptidase-like Zn-dependent dipeptidase
MRKSTTPGVLVLAALLPLPAAAETAVKVQSCAEAHAAFSASPSAATKHCWDFETGLWDYFGGQWYGTLDDQPTYGDNVSADRALQGSPAAVDLTAIGGDYWRTPYPIGHQGSYWIGTRERRSSPAAAWGAQQGDSATGYLLSPSFIVDRTYIHFLLGGGCNTSTLYVELQVQEAGGAWVTAVDSYRQIVLRMTGDCSEVMRRRVWITDAASGLDNRHVRILIRDNSTTGHLNVDHILHTDTYPIDTSGANQPVWGLADTHAHPANHTSSKGTAAGWMDASVFHGHTGLAHAGPNALPLPLSLPSCDGNGHGTGNHGPPLMLATLEKASFGTAPAQPGYAAVQPRWNGEALLGNSAFAGAHPAGGVLPTTAGRDLLGWPYWWTRAHQQMHVTWMYRAYQGGLRLMVASAGNAEILGSFMRSHYDHPYLSDYAALVRFRDHMRALELTNGGWMKIVYSPRQAREAIRANKLAVVLAAEVDDIGDHCSGDFSTVPPPLEANWTEFDGSCFPVFNPEPYAPCGGGERWHLGLRKSRALADSCSTPSEWLARVDRLHAQGFRLLTPIHLTNNDLGGAAVVGDLFHTMQKFLNGTWFSLVRWAGVRQPLSPVLDRLTWCKNCTDLGLLFPTFTTNKAAEATGVTPSYPDYGHINNRALTSNGRTFLRAMRDRGMLIDVSHMGHRARYQVLGINGYASTSTDSIVNPGCDMDDPQCRAEAYPVLASHSGFRRMGLDRHDADFDGRGDENSLDNAMIARIHDIGGTVAVGTAPADVRDTDSAQPGSFSGILSQTVENSCGGSSRSFAQSYVYALRRVGPGGFTIGTDINGFQDQLNPRFGTTACHGRGNIPWVLPLDHTGAELMWSNRSYVPFNHAPRLLQDAMATGVDGTAADQARAQYAWSGGVNYLHYAGQVPGGGGRQRRMQLPAGYVANMAAGNWGALAMTGFGSTTTASMGSLFATDPLTGQQVPVLRASQTGDRTFDFNYDGLAHYGMLPDLLQDLRAVGMPQEQLGPLFQSAEAFIRMWQKACDSPLSDPVLSAAGCN